MKPPPARLDVSREELQNLLEHACTRALSEPEYQHLKAAVDTPVYLTQLVEDKNTTIGRLHQILFGSSSGKMSQVLETLAASRASSEKQLSAAAENVPQCCQSRSRAQGMAVMGLRTIRVRARLRLNMLSLKSGNRCPGCQKGKLYLLTTPGVLIRVVARGSSPRIHPGRPEDRSVLYRASACRRKSGHGPGPASQGVGDADPDVLRVGTQSAQGPTASPTAGGGLSR
jgi:hypothetical protein